MNHRTHSESKPDVGDRVRFRYGLTVVEATIIEDRGNLAPGGQRLLRVRFPWPDDPAVSDEPKLEIELPAEELELLPAE